MMAFNVVVGMAVVAEQIASPRAHVEPPRPEYENICGRRSSVVRWQPIRGGAHSMRHVEPRSAHRWHNGVPFKPFPCGANAQGT